MTWAVLAPLGSPTDSNDSDRSFCIDCLLIGTAFSDHVDRDTMAVDCCYRLSG